ncbi:MAG TPA: hypothetical protein VM389_04760 [Phycisphaerae bacterium]|nr:hypothetical protein [Phycisphaerae bacterium]
MVFHLSNPPFALRQLGQRFPDSTTTPQFLLFNASLSEAIGKQKQPIHHADSPKAAKPVESLPKQAEQPKDVLDDVRRARGL